MFLLKQKSGDVATTFTSWLRIKLILTCHVKLNGVNLTISLYNEFKIKATGKNKKRGEFYYDMAFDYY